MKRCETYEIKIYCGAMHNGKTVEFSKILKIMQSYCNNGFCVSVTETHYVYKNGMERGVVVGLINYPRFPVSVFVLEQHAKNIAAMLKEKLSQDRLSIVYPDRTETIGVL